MWHLATEFQDESFSNGCGKESSNSSMQADAATPRR